MVNAIKAAGAALRFLPPYSPDFDPIENAFSKFEALMRKVAASAIDALNPGDCVGYLTTTGYEPNQTEGALDRL